MAESHKARELGSTTGAGAPAPSRAFAYNDAQRNRIGTNFQQLPVNRPKVPVNTYMFDGQMAHEHSGNAPVYAPNSGERAWSDETGPVRDGWDSHGVVLERAFEYWKNVDAATGKRIEEKVRAGSAPQPAEGMGER